MSETSKYLELLKESFEKNPADWIAAGFLFLGFSLSALVQFWSRKKVGLEFNKRDHRGLAVVVTNNSKDWRIQISRYGIKKWDGTVIEQKFRPIAVNSALSPADTEELVLVDDSFQRRTLVERTSTSATAYEEVIVPWEDIQYIYIIDSNGNYHRKHLNFWVASWLRYYSERMHDLIHS